MRRSRAVIVRVAAVVLMGAVAAMFAAPVSAKISAMSGAYDGRGKPPEVVKPPPSNAKTRLRRGRAVRD
ncbi:MAG: hypothetical protein B7Y80_05400 [Hyphomicrobium sp. 32-62-53]|nr:MAG: hypothetical protein B7Z29_11135 [Hyphomicrobium sp. 12-62-95]OYY00682.1 MAG: hypothetical protein B7Y80_05400 [Hyphomicrobium sp. 32-62-53]